MARELLLGSAESDEEVAETEIASGQRKEARTAADATALLLLPAHTAAPPCRTAKQHALRRQVNLYSSNSPAIDFNLIFASLYISKLELSSFYSNRVV